MESKFQPGDLVYRPSATQRGTLFLVRLVDRSDVWGYGNRWEALGPRGMVSVWESNLTLISR